MLRIDGATVRFGDRVVLEHADLDLGPTETVAVLGPSGSGKTTLLRAVAGLQPLDAGRVCWDDDDLAPVPAHRRRFGLMFQEYALFPHRDVQGNVEFGLRMAGLDRAARAKRVEETLDLVGLGAQRAQRVASLSGGEQQRVALARALAVAPRLLMLDEPLGALDREWRIRLLSEIRTMLDDAHLPALYVTHDHDEAFAIASRVAVMRDGHIVQIGSPAEVWRAPVDAWTATFLGFGPKVEVAVQAGGLDTPWGVIAGHPVARGGVVDVVLRPDAVRVDPHGAIGAVVERVRFTGTHVDVTVRPERGPALSLEVTARDAPSVGDAVRVTLDEEALLVYAHPAD